MKKFSFLLYILIFALEIVFSSAANLKTGSTPTGGAYSLYKLEEYTYCLLAGFIMIFTMGLFISLNEQNAMISENTLSMAKSEAITIANAQIDSKNEGKMVLVTEEIEVKWPIFDEELFFNISKGYKLLRKVEFLQHYELKEPSSSGDYYY